MYCRDCKQISIHAPREGGDDFPEPLQPLMFTNFNPRPPRGGRRGANEKLRLLTIISIHAPREGGDHNQRGRTFSPIKFQSTPPARGATSNTHKLLEYIEISIHAPREGGDSKDAQFYLRIFDK